MKKSDKGFLQHLGAGILAGLLFYLVVGAVFSVKMCIINEATHQLHFAYPFTLNFIAAYLLVGAIFGCTFGLLGGFLLNRPAAEKGLSFILSLGLSLLAFAVIYLLARPELLSSSSQLSANHAGTSFLSGLWQALISIGRLFLTLGPFFAMLFALLIFLRVYALRPPVLGIYYSIFFTGLLFNYSWQWVRQHYLINPLMPIPSAHLWDAVFTIGWAALFLLGYGLALILLHKLPNLVYRVLYSLQTAVVLIALIIFGLKYFALPTPAVAQASLNAEITRRPTDVKIVLIGIDGMWWKIMDPLLAEGKMPTFKKLIDEGASGPLETLFPTFSTTIWSSISTGKSPEQHHVTSFLIWKFPWSGYTLPLFRTPKITAELDWMRQDLIITAPATNQFLDATPIWYMLSDHGASVGTVNWWLSYPADSVNGFVVTDHCLYNKEYVMENFRSREGRTSGDIYPAGLLPELLPFSRSPQDLTRAEVERFIHIESDKFWDEFQAIDTYDYLDIAYEASMFKYSYPEDATFASATEHLIQTLQPDFLCVYLDGMDSMQHQYLKYYFASQHPDKLIPQNLERYRDLIINYYQYMDEVVGDFIAAADSNTIFMVISDHAFDETMMPTGHYNHTEMPPPGTPADSLKFIHPGVFICAGPGIKQGYHIADAQVYDITPTSLYLLGLPAAKDFDGMVLTEIMTAAAPVDSIATYEGMHHSTHQVLQTEKDQEIKEKLKALGYTQ